jgi:hypothetical protein
MYYLLVGLGGALLGWVVGETFHMSVVNSLELKLKSLEQNAVSDAKAVIAIVRSHLGL